MAVEKGGGGERRRGEKLQIVVEDSAQAVKYLAEPCHGVLLSRFGELCGSRKI
jgi:hypothetical protein